jgi:hypothetical protein
MLNLKTVITNIENAQEAHWKFFNYYVNKKIDNEIDCPYENAIDFNKVRNIRSHDIIWLKNFLNFQDRIKTIILGEPALLVQLNNEFEIQFNNRLGINSYLTYFSTKKNLRKSNFPRQHKIITTINSIFNYTFFDSLEPNAPYSAYKLGKNLGIRSCTYCNRSYTLTHDDRKKRKLLKPQFDHWYPESKFPLLSVSFFNLIPCCNYCNNLKSAVNMDLNKHSHPYALTDLDGDYRFSYFFDKSIEKYYIEIDSQNSNKLRDTMKSFRIHEMYEAHQEELKDLIKLREAYSENYIKTLISTFPNANLDKKEVYRLVFGVEYDKENFHKRPFSKFKKDILNSLGIKL